MINIHAHSFLSPRGDILFDLPDLSLKGGQIWAVMGANGVGKSTFLQACSGRDTSAVDPHWFWQNQPLPLWSDANFACQRAFLKQQSVLPSALSVQAVVKMAAYPWGGAHVQLRQYFDEVVNGWDLRHLQMRSCAQLSGGESQRVRLAQTELQIRLADVEQAMWLLDEPLTGLDAPHQQVVIQRLQHCANEGVLVISALHDANTALRLATHFLILSQAGVVYAGERDEARIKDALEQAFAVPLCWVKHPQDGSAWLLPARQS
ncbi:MAG: ATP-binding cassette domain-containing protein [Moraxellaceae bacterium]|nr:ATP-binding cassette domain-containing protein [Moraxellaceae bacterium]MDP1775911.1 ATP-binding cassette domain-containing protein [Moraxellaceae bacterium]